MNKKTNATTNSNLNSSHLKKVLLLHTGGTFGMAINTETASAALTDQSSSASPFLSSSKQGETHLTSPALLGSLFTQVPELKQLAHLELRILCNLDSSDMNPAVWQLIAQTIQTEWDSFDGFVVVHGTDTLAYSAAAVAFFLGGLTKSVVFTGSQRPLSELRTDARANIIDAVELATTGIPEVMVCFDNKVHRGTRVTKHSNEHMQAFRSINTSPLGAFGVHFRVNKRLAYPTVPVLDRHRPSIDLRISDQIFVLDAVPGTLLPLQLIEPLLTSISGLVLRGFGAGNLPLAEGRFEELCKQAYKRSIPVIMASQCQAGTVNLSAYANGLAFQQQHVVSARDMTFESLTVKLMIMLGRKIPFEQRHTFFATPLAAECEA